MLWGVAVVEGVVDDGFQFVGVELLGVVPLRWVGGVGVRKLQF